MEKDKDDSKIRKNLSNKVFGRLTVLSFHHREFHNSKSRIYYLCKCVCGVEKIILGTSLSRGLTTSCGCYRIEKVSNAGKQRRTNGKIISAKQIWKNSYNDGCSFDTFLLLSQKECHYCGSKPSNTYNAYINNNGKLKNSITQDWANQSWFIYNGLDRINSNIPHVKTNIVPCCKTCNYAKRSMTLDEFRCWVRQLICNFSQKEW